MGRPVKTLVFLFAINLFCLPLYAGSWDVDIIPKGAHKLDTLDDRYVNESGDTMEGILDHAGYNVRFDGSNIYWTMPDAETLNLYVGGLLVHTWTGSSAVNYLMLVNGVDYILLVNGTDKILLN